MGQGIRRTLAMALFASVYSYGAVAVELIQLEAVPENAAKPVGLRWPANTEFAPARGEHHDVEFVLDQPASVTVEVLGPDGDVVRTLTSDTAMNTGSHEIKWNGRDDDGVLVPDEAYTPRLVARTDSATIIDDPRHYSGGEIIPNLRWTRRNDTEISYQLDAPARVLIRTGLEDGPMLRELMHWEPVAAGRAVARWDGRDKDGVDYFADRDALWVVVMAYQLPEFAVITTGNDALSYRQYREQKGWIARLPDLSTMPLERRGQRLSRDYFLPRGYLPRVTLDFAAPLETSRVGLPVADSELLLRVNVPEGDRWILDSTFYETGFYVDYAFQSEEEQGFVPLIWSLDTSMLKPGRHLATVQLFGFGGFIASDTVEFLVDDES